jgi:hypothetical protein
MPRPSTFRPRLLVALLPLLATSAGCSLAVRGPSSSWTPAEKPDCTTNAAAPMVDTLAAVAGAGFAAMVAADEEDCGEDILGLCTGIRNSAIGLGVVTAAIYGISALSGWSKVSSCNKAHRKHLDFRLYQSVSGPPGAKRVFIQDPGSVRTTGECRQWREKLFRERNPEERRRIAQRMPAHCH